MVTRDCVFARISMASASMPLLCSESPRTAANFTRAQTAALCLSKLEISSLGIAYKLCLLTTLLTTPLHHWLQLLRRSTLHLLSFKSWLILIRLTFLACSVVPSLSTITTRQLPPLKFGTC